MYIVIWHTTQFNYSSGKLHSSSFVIVSFHYINDIQAITNIDAEEDIYMLTEILI
jgi:hypothetical protein